MCSEPDNPRAASRGPFPGQRRRPRCSWFAVIALLRVLSGRLDADFGFPPDPQPWTKTWPLEDIDINADGIRDFELRFVRYYPGGYEGVEWVAFKLVPEAGSRVIGNAVPGSEGPELLPADFEIGFGLPPSLAWIYYDYALISYNGTPAYDLKGPLHQTTPGTIGVRFQAGDGMHYGWIRFEREDLDKSPWFKIHTSEVGWHPQPDRPLVVGTHPPRPDALPEVEPVDLNGDQIIDLSVFRRIEPNADGSAALWRVWLDGPSLETLTEESGDERVVIGLRERQRLPWSLPPDQAWRPLSTRPLLLSGWRETGLSGEPGLDGSEAPTVGPLTGRLGTFIGLRLGEFGRMAWVKVSGDGEVLDYAWLCPGAGVAGEPPVSPGTWVDRTDAIHDLDEDLSMDVVLREIESGGCVEDFDATHCYASTNLVMIVLGGSEVVGASWAGTTRPVALEPGQSLSPSLPEGQEWRTASSLDLWTQVREGTIWAGGSTSSLRPPEGLVAAGPVFMGLRLPVGEHWRYGWIQVAREGVLDSGIAAELDTTIQVGADSTSEGVHVEIVREGPGFRVTWDPLYRWFDLEGSTGLGDNASWLTLVRADATTGLSPGEHRVPVSLATPHFYRLRRNCPAGGCPP